MRVTTDLRNHPGWLALFVAMGSLLPACTRGPLEVACPSVSAGDLVITEIRGNQSGLDTWGQWIELFNPTGVPLSAGGLVIHLTALDESGLPEMDDEGQTVEADIDLLDSDLVVEAGAWVVAGRFPTYDLPAHVDYGYEAQLGSSLYDAALVELHACGVLIDAVAYADLPSTGSWILDGSQSPNATVNDDPNHWCVDDTAPVTGGGTAAGVPGTPGGVNPTCK